MNPSRPERSEEPTRRAGRTLKQMIQLGVNIDHVATVRQARRTYEPDPVLIIFFSGFDDS